MIKPATTIPVLSTAGRFAAALLTLISVVGSTILLPISSIMATACMLTMLATTAAYSQESTPAAESGSDINPPVIELEAIEQGIAGQDQVFTALVADNGNLLDVKLYHRFSSQQAYQSLLMEPLGRTNYYIGTVATEADETRPIEYYVQARDVAGNRVVEGFAYEPLIRKLLPPDENTPPVPQETATPEGGTTEPTAAGGGIKVWQVVLGVLAVGALAGLAASSGGGDGGSGGQTVPLTITIDSP